MTLDEVMKLSDAELTELAATRVMGWYWGQSTGHHGPFKTWHNAGRRALYKTNWEPCSRWDHAMLLNERMREITPKLGEHSFYRYVRDIDSAMSARAGTRENLPLGILGIFLMQAEPIDITRAAVATVMGADD